MLGCGFMKTASTSLRQALRHLGYRTTGHSQRLFDDWHAGRRWPIYLEALKYQAMKDWPWALCYREIDRWFPGSKFILTVRDPDYWYDSYVRHMIRKGRQRPGRLFSSTSFDDRDAIIDRYLQHNADVRAYFADRPDELLVFNAEAGDGWEQLCGFLGKPIPDMPYPFANRRRT